jgi:hypothetical protein
MKSEMPKAETLKPENEFVSSWPQKGAKGAKTVYPRILLIKAKSKLKPLFHQLLAYP